MPYYLAIDAGGTKTSCLLADDTRILARSSTGSVKLMRVSEAEASSRLTTMLEEVSAAAAVPLTHITRTCIGLAGLSLPAVHTWAATTLSATVAGDVLLLGDDEIALEAAFAGGGGILEIAGTGSDALGCSRAGEIYRAGGRGDIIGDGEPG